MRTYVSLITVALCLAGCGTNIGYSGRSGSWSNSSSSAGSPLETSRLCRESGLTNDQIDAWLALARLARNDGMGAVEFLSGSPAACSGWEYVQRVDECEAACSLCMVAIADEVW